MNNKQHTWTDDEKSRVRQLCADGLTSADIAAQLTTDTFRPTRSSIIGLAARMKFSRPQRHLKPTKRKSDRKRIPTKHARPLPQRPLPRPTTAPRPTVPPISLMELRHNTCRFPVGDDGPPGFSYSFCGSETVAISPYCAHHHQRCYRNRPRWH
jgi:GcrA cell cycle regulator